MAENCYGADDDSDERENETDREDEGTSSVEKKCRREKALLQFRCRVEDAILGNYLLGKPCRNQTAKEREKARENLQDITLWGVPLLPTKGNAGTNVVLSKFLTAKDFNVPEAFEMLRETLKWRREYKTDGILEEKLDSDLEHVVFLKSRDREDRPLFWVRYGVFRDKKLCEKAFGTAEKRSEFLRRKVQYMEKCIQSLSFKHGGVNSVLQISDLNNSPREGIRRIRSITRKTLVLLQENYPEIVHKVIMINVPFWYRASYVLISRFLSQRMKKKFVFARPSEVTKTLLKYVDPENLPVEYGGLMRENDDDFTPADKASELIMRGNSIALIEFPAAQVEVTLVWDITVVGWDVSFKEEFIPDDEGSYKILIQNQKQMGRSVRNSFYIREPGRLVITIDNDTFKKKRVFHRSKVKPAVPMYLA